MEELTLTTPSLLFSAISLIMLAYTNRFLSYAQVVRNISAEYTTTKASHIPHQIENLRRRLYLCRTMQILGIFSLFLCVICMFMIYVGWHQAAVYTFAIALIALIISLGVSIREILISVHALDIYLDSIKKLEEQEEKQ